MSQLPRGVIQKGGRFYLRIRKTVDGPKTETTEPLGANEVIARAAGRRRRRQHQEWKDQPTVCDFGERWLLEYVTPMRTNKGPALARQRLSDYVLPVLGNLFVAEVTEAHGMALRASLERPRRRTLRSGDSVETFLSTMSVRHVLSDARCPFSFAIAAPGTRTERRAEGRGESRCCLRPFASSKRRRTDRAGSSPADSAR